MKLKNIIKRVIDNQMRQTISVVILISMSILTGCNKQAFQVSNTLDSSVKCLSPESLDKNSSTNVPENYYANITQKIYESWIIPKIDKMNIEIINSRVK